MRRRLTPRRRPLQACSFHLTLTCPSLRPGRGRPRLAARWRSTVCFARTEKSDGGPERERESGLRARASVPPHLPAAAMPARPAARAPAAGPAPRGRPRRSPRPGGRWARRRRLGGLPWVQALRVEKINKDNDARRAEYRAWRSRPQGERQVQRAHAAWGVWVVRVCTCVCACVRGFRLAPSKARRVCKQNPLCTHSPFHNMWAASRRRAGSIAALAGRSAFKGVTPPAPSFPAPAQSFQPHRRANVVGAVVKAAQIYRALQGRKP